MNTFSHVPPGFRFHPTDEELVDYYLRRKVTSRRIDLDVIKDVDLYKIEPWDLQELCRIGTEEQNEWYFFSHKDKKYPTGTRTNRATTAGFWKATGRDKAIYSKHDLVGMRKTLVFYKGRAPNGLKSDWIMHEYRLETDENGTPQEEGWVVCRVFKKRLPTVRRMGEHDSPIWYDDQVSFIPDLESPKENPNPNYLPNYHHPHNSYACKKEMDFSYQNPPHHGHFFQLPLLDGPKLLLQTNPMAAFGQQEQIQQAHNQNLNYYGDQAVDQVTDWRVLDKFVASQLSQEEAPKENDNSNNAENCFFQTSSDHELINKQDQMGPENAASTSNSSCQMDLWK